MVKQNALQFYLIKASCGDRTALDAGEQDPIIGALLIIAERGDLDGVVGASFSSSSLSFSL